MNPNASFIREIINLTQPVKGVKVEGDKAKEIKANVQSILRQQRQMVTPDART